MFFSVISLVFNDIVNFNQKFFRGLFFWFFMKVFYGGSIQGAKNRGERSEVHQFLINCIKKNGYDVYTEHTTGENYDESIRKLEESIGKMPEDGDQRRKFVRNKMIEGAEGDISAAIFEVSIPSLGTGIEIAHAYLRPRMNLNTIPVLCLYQKDYWPNKLSTMIRGISKEEVPHFNLEEYESLDLAEKIIVDFLSKL